MIKNLNGQDYPDRFLVSENINTLSNEAKGNEYRLGMVLYASAQQGDQKFYQQTLLRMQKELSALEKEEKDSKLNSYKTWRLGRILLAADSINDESTAKATLVDLKKLLADKDTAKDAFSAWAWGYLAAFNADEYKLAKTEMLSSAVTLSEQYYQAKSTKESKDPLQSKLSDALWAWVMAIQAAANAKDKETIQFILEQMKKITDQETVALALTKGLQRLSDSNDYPAWAISIVHLAAATIGDESLYNELENPLRESIQGAKDSTKSDIEKVAYGARAEATLAQLALALSTIRWNEQHKLQKRPAVQ